MKSLSKNKMAGLNSLRVFLVVVAIAFTAMSCTKKKDMKNMIGADGVKASDKTVFSADGVSLVGGGVFSLSRGVEDAQQTTMFGAVPGISNDYGTVRAEITESSLRFIQDYGVNNRAETATVLLAFPIKEHYDVVQEKNDFGDGTNKIVKDSTTKPWNERQYMVVDWASPSNPVGKMSFQVAGGEKVEETDAVLVQAPQITEKDINFATEVSIDANRVLMRTHLAKIPKSDFKPVIYNRNDFNRFGYFMTEHMNKNQDGVQKEENDLHYAEMFNVCEAGRSESCSTNKIVWKLSKGFPDRYIEKTRQVVREWNQTFQSALNRSDDVVVLDETQVDMSDPTSNVIAYYEPDAGGGLLGVAQGTVDWRTGEKLSARATIYGDGIRYTLGNIDTLIDLLIDDKASLDVLKNEGTETVGQKIAKGGKELNVLDVVRKSRPAGVKVSTPIQVGSSGDISSIISKNITSVDRSVVKTNALENAAIASPQFSAYAARDTELLSQYLQGDDLSKATNESFHRLITLGAALKAQRQKMSAFGSALNVSNIAKLTKATLSAEALGVHSSEVVEEAAIRYIQQLLKDGMTVESLKANRESIKENIAQLTYYTTLLHEMGHTFGLRHNFEGTADENNFMPQYFEVQAKLNKQDPSVKKTDLDPHMYSSIMDYHADFYAGVGGLGPYDKAAIKYAYNRMIDKDKAAVNAKGQPYMFCTDDDLGERVTCRQFDKGTTVAEITQNQIDRLKRNYITSHFRRGRAGFLETYQDYISLESRLFSQYSQVRQSIDEMVYQYQVQGLDQKGCPRFITNSVARNEMEDVCDPKVAATLQGNDVRELARLLKPLPPGQKYIVDGFADLVLAGKEAMQFFADTLGSPEPGIYTPGRGADGSIALKRVAGIEGATDQEIDDFRLKYLTNAAVKSGAKTADEIQKFIQQNSSLLVTLKPGPVAKYLYARQKRGGFGMQTDRVPFLLDKEIALVALATRDLGIAKYSDESVHMAGNAYLWFHTADWTHQIFEAIMKGDGKLTTYAVNVPGQDKPVDIPLPGALDRNLQIQSMALGMTEFASFDDTDFANRIKFYRGNDSAMAGIEGLEKASFKSEADGGAMFTAFQTPDGKSISYNIAKQAADAGEASNRLQAIVQDPAGQETAAAKNLKDAEPKRVKAEKAFANNKDIVALGKAYFSKAPDSLWSRAQANLSKSVDAKADANAVQAEAAALRAATEEADAIVGKTLAGHLQSAQDLNCYNQISNSGSTQGLGPQCKGAIAVFNVGAAYSDAMNAILEAISFVEDTKDTAQHLQHAQADLAAAQDDASLLSSLQKLLGL